MNPGAVAARGATRIVWLMTDLEVLGGENWTGYTLRGKIHLGAVKKGVGIGHIGWNSLGYIDDRLTDHER